MYDAYVQASGKLAIGILGGIKSKKITSVEGNGNGDNARNAFNLWILGFSSTEAAKFTGQTRANVSNQVARVLRPIFPHNRRPKLQRPRTLNAELFSGRDLGPQVKNFILSGNDLGSVAVDYREIVREIAKNTGIDVDPLRSHNSPKESKEIIRGIVRTEDQIELQEIFDKKQTIRFFRTLSCKSGSIEKKKVYRIVPALKEFTREARLSNSEIGLFAGDLRNHMKSKNRTRDTIPLVAVMQISQRHGNTTNHINRVKRNKGLEIQEWLTSEQGKKYVHKLKIRTELRKRKLREAKTTFSNA